MLYLLVTAAAIRCRSHVLAAARWTGVATGEGDAVAIVAAADDARDGHAACTHVSIT